MFADTAFARDLLDSPRRTTTRIQLLGGFSVQDQIGFITLSASACRLLAFLAIQDHPAERGYTASCLWMDKSDARAQANLRSCLWRMRQVRTQIVCCSATHLWLDESVSVDLHQIRVLARAMMAGAPVDLSNFDPDALCAELLPTWYDDFVDIEREQLRQLRLHALEHVADQYRRVGNWGSALRIALTAVGCEPLRESAHRMVISIHIEEGNICEAVRQYQALVAILRAELGIAPSRAATELVRRWI